MTKQQMIGIYMLLWSGIGGLIVANVEVYFSPTISNKCNLIMDIIHTLGAFIHIIFGNVAYLFYNHFNMFSINLLCITIFLVIVFRINRSYQYKLYLIESEKQMNDEYEKWVDNISRIKISLEIAAITPSLIAMCLLIYQFTRTISLIPSTSYQIQNPIHHLHLYFVY